MIEHAQQLLARLEAAEEWPPKDEQSVRETILLWQAFRESDRTRLTPDLWERDRKLIIDPLPERIAEAFADLIFGEDPEFTAADDTDQDNVDGLIDDNDLPSELQRAEAICSSEGEVWWRILIDKDAALYPRIEWHSRLACIPLYRGRDVIAVAFFSTVASEGEGARVWRYLEVQAAGINLNRLYRGASDKLGERVKLTDQDATKDLRDEWRHDLPGLLAGRVVNRVGRNPRLGISDYAGVRDLLDALNEAATIGQENARLTAKKRVVIPQRFLDKDGNFPTGAEVIIATETDQDPDKPGQGLAQVEFSFDAAALIAYKSDLTDTILTRCRVAPQLVGRQTGNTPESGTALRARLLDSVLAANGKARFWDDALPKVLSLAAQADALPGEKGGNGRKWAKPAEPPSVKRASVLPEDESDIAERHALEVQAEIKSRQTAIEEAHPDWSEERVTEELRRIREDTAVALADPPPEP